MGSHGATTCSACNSPCSACTRLRASAQYLPIQVAGLGVGMRWVDGRRHAWAMIEAAILHQQHRDRTQPQQFPIGVGEQPTRRMLARAMVVLDDQQVGRDALRLANDGFGRRKIPIDRHVRRRSPCLRMRAASFSSCSRRAVCTSRCHAFRSSLRPCSASAYSGVAMSWNSVSCAPSPLAICAALLTAGRARAAGSFTATRIRRNGCMREASRSARNLASEHPPRVRCRPATIATASCQRAMTPRGSVAAPATHRPAYAPRGAGG